MRLVNHFLERSVERFPDKTALIVDEARFSYSEIDELANRIAHALVAEGVQRGDRVAIHLPNSLEAVVAIFAILKASAVFVMVNPSVKAQKMDYILRDAGTHSIVLPATKVDKLETTLSKAGVKAAVVAGELGVSRTTGSVRYLSWSDMLERHSNERPASIASGADLAALMYTSGSTGEPKGVVCGHDNMVFVSGSIVEYLQNTPDDIVINALPFSFDYGLYQLLMVFSFGGTLVLEDGFAFPTVFLRRIEQRRVTGVPGVPTMFATILQYNLDSYDFGSVRYLTNTAAALPVSHIERLREAFPNQRLLSMYGLTECKRALYLPPEELARRPGSVGIPIPGTRAWIVDQSGHRLDAGQTGELVVRGPHVMRGYWNKPQASERFQPTEDPAERLLYTGDLVRQDADGFFHFVARQDDIIKSRGEKVAPKEIESVLYALDGILEASVVGVTDPLLGEAIKAMVVVVGEGLTELDILHHCRQHLEDFMVPHVIEFKESLPKTDSGKISRIAGDM